jgi:hypothetical protein
MHMLPKALGLTLTAGLLLAGPAIAQSRSPQSRAPRPSAPGNPVTLPPPIEARSFDGSGNNLAIPERGAAGAIQLRFAPADYGDGIAALAGSDRPGPRAVSNAACTQDEPVANARGASDFLWQWGQFLDHDLDLTQGSVLEEPADIAVPAGDPFFDPAHTGTAVIGFLRSGFAPETGTDPDNPREQINEISAFIDASMVYGSDAGRARALRTLDGSGRLETSEGDLLPFNTEGLDNAGGTSAALFIAGDIRANEQLGLTSLHTLFVREHNRLARSIARITPGLGDDQIYERARRIVGAQIQVITYREFLPVLLGNGALAPYRGYRSSVDPGIRNEFATAAFRVGHTMLSPTLLRLGADGEPIAEGHLALRDAFFAGHRLVDEGGIDPVLRGLAAQPCQEIDPYIADDVRNFLFGAPGAGGFDLASLNIQRGRDHGLPAYNDARRALGLPAARRFADITSDPLRQEQLAAAYTTVDDIDLWVGGLAEDHRPGAMVGELFFRILKRQFEALRDGDRFWYERALAPLDRLVVENTRLGDIIRRNTGIGSELGRNVFLVP